MIYLRELLPPYDEPWAELLMADTKDGMTYALSLWDSALAEIRANNR